MKTILVLIVFLAFTGLNQATIESQDEKQQLKNLKSLVGLVGWLVGRSYIKALSGPRPKSMMNKNWRFNLPRPQSFYPIRIRNPKVKEKWDDFEYYKGLGPVTPRPFTYLDLRIIGWRHPYLRLTISGTVVSVQIKKNNRNRREI